MSEPTLRRYVVRKDGEWGEFVIGSNGYFSVASTYGGYAFRWSAFSEDFRSFLVSAEADYVASKLTHGWSYDGSETLKRVKGKIEELIREKFLKRSGREELSLLNKYEQLETEINFDHWLNETKIPEAYELAMVGYGRQLGGMMVKLWPVFLGMLRDELALELRGAA